MVQLSNAAIRMSTVDRTKQELNWYTGGIYLCTQICDVADKIEAECKRRKIDYTSVWARELLAGKNYTSCDLAMGGYNIYKIYISKSLETTGLDKKLHAGCGVPALKKKQLTDWAVTTFNDKEEPIWLDRYSDSYNVWIQPSSDVMNPITMTEEEYEEGHETHWIEFR